MAQTEVTTAPLVGTPGRPADEHTAQNGQVVSATSEEASALIPFGVMVKQGSGDYGALKLTATTNAFIGISFRSNDFAVGLEIDESTGNLKPGATFGVARKGRFFVLIEEDVTPASDVRVRCVATGNEVAGAFRATADSTDCVDLTGLARWIRTADADDGVGELEIDMTNIGLAVADV
jgi:hypothetical protein